MGKGILEWDEGFSVGIQTFDDQHKRIFGIVNRVYAALKERKDPASRQWVSDALDELAEYTEMHFKAEEDAMRRHGFPEYEAHKKEHDDFVRKAAEFRARFEKGEAAVTVELLGSLASWLDTHLNGTDKRYTAYLSARNVR